MSRALDKLVHLRGDAFGMGDRGEMAAAAEADLPRPVDARFQLAQTAPRNDTRDPVDRAARAVSHHRQRKLPIVVVKNLEAVVAAITHRVQAPNQRGDLFAVHAFAGEDTVVTRSLDAFVGFEMASGGPGGIYWYEFPSSGNPNDNWARHPVIVGGNAYGSSIVNVPLSP